MIHTCNPTVLLPDCRESFGEGRRFPGSGLKLRPRGLCFDLFLDERAHALQDHKSGSSAQNGASVIDVSLSHVYDFPE